MKVLVHVGYHKTATTWMQRRLFIPENGYVQIASHEDVWKFLVGLHGLCFDPAPLREVISERLKEVPNGLVPVISSELISGHPFFGGLGSDVFAERLSKVIPEARILVTIRSQSTMLPSIYMQYLRRGGTSSPENFFSGNNTLGFQKFAPEHFEYHRLLQRYKGLFKEVRLQAFEALKNDFVGAITGLGHFSGLDSPTLPETSKEGASAPEFCVPVLRRLNHFRPSPMNMTPVLCLATETRGPYQAVEKLGKKLNRYAIIKKQKPVRRYIEQAFADRFTQSNLQLAEISPNPIDLSAYP